MGAITTNTSAQRNVFNPLRQHNILSSNQQISTETTSSISQVQDSVNISNQAIELEQSYASKLTVIREAKDNYLRETNRILTQRINAGNKLQDKLVEIQDFRVELQNNPFVEPATITKFTDKILRFIDAIHANTNKENQHISNQQAKIADIGNNLTLGPALPATKAELLRAEMAIFQQTYRLRDNVLRQAETNNLTIISQISNEIYNLTIAATAQLTQNAVVAAPTNYQSPIAVDSSINESIADIQGGGNKFFDNSLSDLENLEIPTQKLIKPRDKFHDNCERLASKVEQITDLILKRMNWLNKSKHLNRMILMHVLPNNTKFQVKLDF